MQSSSLVNTGDSEKDKSVTGKYNKDEVSKKLKKKYYQKQHPVTGFKHVELLHDNAPYACHCYIFANREGNIFIIPLLSPDLALVISFFFPKLKTVRWTEISFQTGAWMCHIPYLNQLTVTHSSSGFID